MSSINQILNSALMESSTNLEEVYSKGVAGLPLTKREWLNDKYSTGKEKVIGVKNWADTKMSGITDNQARAIKGAAIGTGLLTAGGLIAKNTEEAQGDQSRKQDSAAADSKFKDVMAARAAAAAAKPPAEPPKSFVQQYGDQAKAMWDKAVADGTAKWNEFSANPNAGKYGAAGLVALGAGIGAVALAKKLRAKKAAVKK